MSIIKYCLIAGYGWSGSSAVVDLLREFENCYVPDVEFRVVKDPYALYDLYRNLIDKWYPLNCDIAIKDFKWHMEHLYYKSSKVSLKSGLNYKTYFGENFMVATNKFIDKIVRFKYKGSWWFFDFKRSKTEFLITKIKNKLGGKSKDYLYFPCLTEQDFLTYAREYIDELFEPLIKNKGKENVVLDQAVSVTNFKREIMFFNNSKLIVVDRDPRDIYSDLILGENLIGKELKESHDFTMFIQYHQAWRRNIDEIKKDADVLFLQFEDLVFKYDECVQKIMEFFELNDTEHVDKKKYFDPSISKKNIGIWRECLSAEEQRGLEAALKEYFVQ